MEATTGATAWWKARCSQEMRAGSWKLRLAGEKVRNQLAAAFVTAVILHEGNERKSKAEFKKICRGYGNPLLFLLIGIAWQILWYFWTHRTG